MWTGTIFDGLRESGNLPDEIASLTQEVKYSKVNPLSFKILIGISLGVALFEGNPSITSQSMNTDLLKRKLCLVINKLLNFDKTQVIVKAFQNVLECISNLISGLSGPRK